MMPLTTLAFSGVLHEQLRAHLFPGDGLEACAIVLCSRTPMPRLRLLAREAILVPYDACRRGANYLSWPGRYIESAIDRAEREQLTVFLIHSHPGGLFAFSDIDDRSDHEVIPSLFQALGNLHGSAIMTPRGAMRARLYAPDLVARPVDLVSVAGHDIQLWWECDAGVGIPPYRPLAFTGGMRRELGRLCAAAIGVSGTGSIVGEALARLGFGCVKAIDFDRVERRNLDRIVNSSLADVDTRRLKVDVYADAVVRYRGDRIVDPIAASILSRQGVLAASQSDVLFCNVDTLEARQIADLMSAAFLLPLVDVGVTIPLRKAKGGISIADVCGRIDYVQPGRSSLWDRGVYTAEGLRAEYLRRVAPDDYAREVQEGYFKGLSEDAPAVITLNMRAASAAVNEFVARAYPFRLEPNERYARTTFSLAACEEEHLAEADFAASFNSILARGCREPLIGLPALATDQIVATLADKESRSDANATMVA